MKKGDTRKFVSTFYHPHAVCVHGGGAGVAYGHEGRLHSSMHECIDVTFDQGLQSSTEATKRQSARRKRQPKARRTKPLPAGCKSAIWRLEGDSVVCCALYLADTPFVPNSVPY